MYVLYRSTTTTTTTTQTIPTEAPELYQTTRTNFNYHPIMEYFVSPNPSKSPLNTSVRSQDIMQRKSDFMVVNNEFQSPRNGWTPMMEEYGPRNLH